VGNRVVITGMGAVSSLGNSVASMWDGLVHGRCGIGPLTRVNADLHRIKHAAEAGLPSPTHNDWPTDPAMQFALAAGIEAIEQAKIALQERTEVALILASNFGPMSLTEKFLEEPNAASAQQALHADATRRVAEILELGGAHSTLSLSCASGNAAIGYAADMIRSGNAQVLLAGGYDAISEVVWAGLSALRAMSEHALRPFDKRRDGTIFGDGAGLLVLESADHAKERGATVLAEFAGYATSSNAFHMTHPDADGAGMARAMRGALRDAGTEPEAIDHINAHATGTPSNDKLETAAIKTVFGQRATAIPINGIKSMLGHAMGASSSLESIATIMTLREGIIPPTLNLDEPDPECDLAYTPHEARKAGLRAALNNSAGFGGCNASVVFTRWDG